MVLDTQDVYSAGMCLEFNGAAHLFVFNFCPFPSNLFSFILIFIFIFHFFFLSLASASWRLKISFRLFAAITYRAAISFRLLRKQVRESAEWEVPFTFSLVGNLLTSCNALQFMALDIGVCS